MESCVYLADLEKLNDELVIIGICFFFYGLCFKSSKLIVITIY